MTAQHVTNALMVYFTFAAVFFLVTFEWAKEALQQDIDDSFKQPIFGLLVFLVVHLLISLVWPMAVSDMVRTFIKSCR